MDVEVAVVAVEANYLTIYFRSDFFSFFSLPTFVINSRQAI